MSDPLGRWGSKLKNGPIKKLRIQLGLHIRRPGKKIDPQKRVFDDGVCI